MRADLVMLRRNEVGSFFLFVIYRAVLYGFSWSDL